MGPLGSPPDLPRYAGDLSQLGMDPLEQMFRGSRIARSDGGEDTGDVGHGWDVLG